MAMARPWNPEYKHTERERWICIYPCYINGKKTIAEGRRIPKEKAVDAPSILQIKEACVAAQFTLGVENKVHPRELYPRDKEYRGRVRVQIKDAEGQALYEKHPNKRSVLLHVSSLISRMKRVPDSASGSSSQPSQSGNKKKKKK